MGALEQRRRDALRFIWLGFGNIPAALDLRCRGWLLNQHARALLAGVGIAACENGRVELTSLSAACASLRQMGIIDIGHVDIGLLDIGLFESHQRSPLLAAIPAELRRFILVAGVDLPAERAALLQDGFGDAVDLATGLDEIEARAARLADLSKWVPRIRVFGELKLDLLAREAYRSGRPLNLNPREFTLLWRLTDSPNQIVSKPALIRDVWRMGFVPVTNSIAVHMSRLRRKLGFAGLDGIIETAAQGGYCLRVPGAAPDFRPEMDAPALHPAALGDAGAARPTLRALASAGE